MKGCPLFIFTTLNLFFPELTRRPCRNPYSPFFKLPKANLLRPKWKIQRTYHCLFKFLFSLNQTLFLSIFIGIYFSLKTIHLVLFLLINGSSKVHSQSPLLYIEKYLFKKLVRIFFEKTINNYENQQFP